jgi:DNA-binding transcriptional regulator YiaG
MAARKPTGRERERLRQERKRRGWSANTVANKLHNLGIERGVAEHQLGVDGRTVYRWESGRTQPNPVYAALLSILYNLPPEELDLPPLVIPVASSAGATREVTTTVEIVPPALYLGTEPAEHISNAPSPSLADDAIDLAGWIDQTDLSDDTISVVAERTFYLTENHTRTPPRFMLADVIRAHRKVQMLMRAGKYRLRQARELFQIESNLLAHACILLGDLHHDQVAISYGLTAALCAREAGATQAIALSAQAKTERWRHRYAASADLARRGFECSPATPLKVLLACQEANAAALLGDHDRARSALQRAQAAADLALAADSGVNLWSCPRPRQALFQLSVALRAGKPEEGLRAAEMADAGWASGEPKVHGTWAQVRFATGIAYVMMGELDGAAEQVAPVMSTPPEFRLATITNYLVDMEERLQHAPFHDSTVTASLREQIHDFVSTALPASDTGEEVI